MSNILSSSQYQQLLERFSHSPINWEKLSGTSLLVTGATGLIGSFLVDLLMHRNCKYANNIKIIALGRSAAKVETRFKPHLNSPLFSYHLQDTRDPFTLEQSVDYIFHAASNSHPMQYSTDPVGTITTNVIGTYNILEYARRAGVRRTLFLSTVEIYGSPREGQEEFCEGDLGYIDCATARAGYGESKRTSEALCASYIAQHQLDIVIPRLCRIFGPTMQLDDSKAVAQLLKNCVNNQSIVLKSEGKQFFSYLHVADAVIGLLLCLLEGVCGQAYNLADPKCDTTLVNMASILAAINNQEVIFALPDEVERRGYSTALKAILNVERIRALGFDAQFDIGEGLANTVSIMRQIA